MSLWLLVFVSDAFLAYLEGIYIDARDEWKISKAVWTAGLFAAAVGVNSMGFVELHWPMLLPSISGAMLGTRISFCGKKRPLDKSRAPD